MMVTVRVTGEACFKITLWLSGSRDRPSEIVIATPKIKFLLETIVPGNYKFPSPFSTR